MYSLDFFSWEPCILRHPSRYDNPWDEQIPLSKRVRSPVTHKQVRATNIDTGAIIISNSPSDADRALGVSIGTTWKSLYRKSKVLRTWKVEYIA